MFFTTIKFVEKAKAGLTEGQWGRQFDMPVLEPQYHYFFFTNTPIIFKLGYHQATRAGFEFEHRPYF